MENIAKNWFQNIKEKTKDIVGNTLSKEELESIDNSEKIESGEDE